VGKVSKEKKEKKKKKASGGRGENKVPIHLACPG